MRILEAVLLVAEALTLLALALPRLRQTRWAWLAGFCALLAAFAQLFVEGFRWQMAPAYGLAVLLAAILALRTKAGGAAWTAGLAGLAVVLALAIALPALVPMFQFPAPSGPHAIGTLTYHWVDPARADFGDPSARREIMVQVWYPAQPVAGAERDSYIQDGVAPSLVNDYVQLPAFAMRHFHLVKTHAVEGAPIAEGDTRYPVLLFSPGAQGFRQHNTFEVEELVSHGYVVAAIDHPRAASQVVLPDGRLVDFDPGLIDIPRFFSEPAFGEAIFNYLAGDVSFALTQIAGLDAADPNQVLTGHLDTGATGMFGVSLGGLVAAEACRIDPRLKACLIQDVFMPADVIRDRVDQPTMWLTRDAAGMRDEGWPEWEVDLHQSSMAAAFKGASAEGYLVHIPGMFHVNYTDFPYTIATPVARAAGLIGPIDWRRGHQIVNAYALAFFDRHLRGKPAPLLEDESPPFREVELQRHVPAS